jgi:Asp-tRNA(Asn)/Glu-tRNA(Gln) amidotransferase A subunit family amidase
MMKKEGAIPIVRGNLPQFVWVGHTENRIFGRALNPYDKTRTCGGSSGGDGALVSSRCVVFAIGTDIGGSIRSPAACSGIIGFKPTAQRTTNRGVLVPTAGYSMD